MTNFFGPGSFGGGFNKPTFSPLSLPNLVVWYQASADTVTVDGSNKVSQWRDRSGNGYHLAQATGANQPVFSATGGPNSQPELQFDGTNHWMANTSFPDFADVATIYSVYDMEAGDTSQLAYEITSGTGALNTGIQEIYDSTTSLHRAAAGGGTKSVTVTESLPVVAKVRCLVYDGAGASTLKFYENGTQVGGTTTSVGLLTNTLARLYIGKTTTANYLLKGGMSALLIYQGVHTDAQRNSVERYLGAPYALL